MNLKPPSSLWFGNSWTPLEQFGDFPLPLDVPVWLFFWTSVLHTWQVISAVLDGRRGLHRLRGGSLQWHRTPAGTRPTLALLHWSEVWGHGKTDRYSDCAEIRASSTEVTSSYQLHSLSFPCLRCRPVCVLLCMPHLQLTSHVTKWV